MELRSLSEFIQQQKEFIDIIDPEEYTRVTVKLHRKGIVLRDKIKGHQIKTKKQQVCRKNQLLVAEIDAKVGGYGIVPELLEGSIVSSHYYLFNIDDDNLLTEYLKYILKTNHFFSQINAQGSTNYASIRPKDVFEIRIPYCNIEEQRKTVAKLNKISKQKKILSSNILINEGYIKKLRHAILSDAVQGKLVPQDPNDEPASLLLEKIKAEKEKLIREKKIRKEKPLPPISEDEISYELPKGWEWVQFEGIKENKPNALKAGPFGSALKKSCYVQKGYKIYGQEQVINQDPNFGNYYIDEGKYQQLKSCEVKPGDILISLVGTVGKVLILQKNIQPGIINPRLVKISLYKNISREYIRLFLYSNIAKKMITANFHGSTMDIINLGILKKIFIPLPPLNEQKRIVQKVDQLMALCDQLESQIQENQKNSEALMNAVLREAFEM